MTFGKWEERYRKQVETNNLLSDKLRETRKRGQKMIDSLQYAYSKKVTEVINLQYKLQALEPAILTPEQEEEDETGA